MRKALQYIVPLIVAFVLMWWVLKDVNPDTIWNNLHKADFVLLTFVMILAMFSHLARAYRWNLLLEPLGYKVSLKNSFIAVMTAYFGNIFLPRGGEVMRCMVLHRSNKIPFASAFGTVVAERVIDFVSLLFLIGLSLLLEFDRFMIFFQQTVFKKNTTESAGLSMGTIIIIAGIAGAIVFFVFKKHFLKINFINKVYAFIIDLFTQAWNSFRNLKKQKLFLISTIVIWLLYYLVSYLSFFTLPFTSHLDLLAGLVILIVGGLGMSAPASGGIGPFHYMVSGALTLFYGLSKDDGVAFALILHSAQLILLFSVGGICALWSLFLKPEKETAQD